jgi:hypothetical protein
MGIGDDTVAEARATLVALDAAATATRTGVSELTTPQTRSRSQPGASESKEAGAAAAQGGLIL